MKIPTIFILLILWVSMMNIYGCSATTATAGGAAAISGNGGFAPPPPSSSSSGAGVSGTTFNPGVPTATFISLADSRWQLQRYGLRGAEKSVMPGSNVSAVFGSDGRISGSGGCNNYFGKYSAGTDGSISIGQVGRTKRYCSGGLSDQEEDYFELLQSVTAYGIDNNGLSLYNNNIVLFFTAQ